MVSPSKHKCDRHLISLYTITSESNVKVMSTKEMITLLPNSYRVTEAVESLGTRLGNATLNKEALHCLLNSP